MIDTSFRASNGWNSMLTFGHQISICCSRDFDLYQNTEEHTNNIDTDMQPSLFIQFCASNKEGIKSIVGHGILSILVRQGTYDFNVQTCKPIISRYPWDEIVYRLNNYYFGCTTCSFNDMNSYFTKQSGVVNDNKDQISSETSGRP
mmetsp:Transcript_4493/g.5064  ORF Transcript_4493/g.5064 Transcript_4493/m.5064 type:complete len:146 (-) Transcript_4493:32-469(-)